MTTLTNTLKMAAVTLTVAAGCASAQGMKAEIPFTFKAGGMLQPAGSYHVLETTGTQYLQLRNADTLRSILLMPGMRSDAPGAWQKEGNPKVSFLCADGRCVLNEIWNGSGQAYRFPMPAFGKNAKTSIAVIVLHRGSGD